MLKIQLQLHIKFETIKSQFHAPAFGFESPARLIDIHQRNYEIGIQTV